MQDELIPALMMGIPCNGHTRPILQLMTIPTIRKQSCLPRPRMKACRWTAGFSGSGIIIQSGLARLGCFKQNGWKKSLRFSASSGDSNIGKP